MKRTAAIIEYGTAADLFARDGVADPGSQGRGPCDAAPGGARLPAERRAELQPGQRAQGGRRPPGGVRSALSRRLDSRAWATWKRRGPAAPCSCGSAWATWPAAPESRTSPSAPTGCGPKSVSTSIRSASTPEGPGHGAVVRRRRRLVLSESHFLALPVPARDFLRPPHRVTSAPPEVRPSRKRRPLFEGAGNGDFLRDHDG